MPELVEIELYRTALAPITGRRITELVVDPPGYVRRGVPPADAAVACRGAIVIELRRHGKLLIVDTDRGPSLGLRFGMTGRPVLDGGTPVIDLEYGPVAADPRWDRVVIHFDGGGRLRVNDPRRLGSLELDPSTAGLGPDAASIEADELDVALASRAPVKAVLLDQARIAGLGNMLVDECLFRAGIDPARAAASLDPEERTLLHQTVLDVVAALLAAGGSHLGALSADRRTPGARCPVDGSPLVRRTIGGRTTYSCSSHQPPVRETRPPWC